MPKLNLNYLTSFPFNIIYIHADIVIAIHKEPNPEFLIRYFYLLIIKCVILIGKFII